jgi:hypothetical protein
MDLLGRPFLVLLCLLAVGLMVGTGLLWSRWPRRTAVAGRGLCLVLVMTMGAMVAGDAVNREFGFYASFGELLRRASAAPPASFGVRPGEARLTVLTPGWQAGGAAAARNGHGIVLDVRFGGPGSGIDRAGLVYLPAAYFTGRPDVAYPSLELFHGFPGRPRAFTNQLAIARVLDVEIAAQRIPPLIAAIPTTYEGGASSECADAIRGERDETYLAVDVPADLEGGFRVLPGRSSATLGYSTGGFCAVNLGLRHPDRFAAAASLSGYFTAGVQDGTKGLYRGSRAAGQRSSCSNSTA